MAFYFFFAIIMMSLTLCDGRFAIQVVKDIILTPNNINEDGANIKVVHQTEVSEINSKWNIMSIHQIGFHLKVSLDETWGFMDEMSTIGVLIHTDTYGKSFTGDILTCFSVDNSQYITAIIHMSNIQKNQIWPNPAGTSKLNNFDPYKRPAHGDIEVIVNDSQSNASRTQKATNNNSIHDIPFMTSMNNIDTPYNNSWPLYLRVNSYPNYNDLVLDVINMELPWELHQHNDFVQVFPLNQGLDIYFAVANNGDSLNITAIQVYNLYNSTSPTTVEPINTPPITDIPDETTTTFTHYLTTEHIDSLTTTDFATDSRIDLTNAAAPRKMLYGIGIIFMFF